VRERDDERTIDEMFELCSFVGLVRIIDARLLPYNRDCLESNNAISYILYCKEK